MNPIQTIYVTTDPQNGRTGFVMTLEVAKHIRDQTMLKRQNRASSEVVNKREHAHTHPVPRNAHIIGD